MKRYHSGQQFANPYFTKVQQQWLWQNDRWAYLATGLLITTLLGYFTVQQRWLWINEVQVSGNQYITTEQITQPASQALDSRRWLILPQRVYFFSSAKKIESAIRSNLEGTLALEQLTVTKDFPHTIHINIQERLPGLTYIVNDHYYYLDKEGIVTKQLANVSEVDSRFPHVRDANQRSIAVGNSAVNTAMIDFIITLHKTFTDKTQLNISEYKLPVVTCQKKTFVAEKLLTEEINNTENVELKEQKKAILDRLQNQEITVDQSLTELEALKRTETINTNSNVSSADQADFVSIKTQFVNTDCNYINVLREVNIVTQEGPEIYFDVTLDMDLQYEHLLAVLNEKIDDIHAIKYVDLRYQDKVYYQ